MQTAKTVLEVIHRRGIEGKTLERLYRQLFNEEIYLKAYAEIYSNKGGLTRGISKETIDAMSVKRIHSIIKRLRTETYRWKPTRREYIPKKDGKKRPLGILSGDDKILQAVLKTLLEAYYEPQFSDRSHGYRPNRGCHTALQQIGRKHHTVSWFIEADIRGCFDNIDHDILIDILSDKIKDGRFIRLLKHLMKAGYVEDWKWHKTYSGTPQGGIISPLLSNIYLNELDIWAEKELMPEYNRKPKSGRKKMNPEYKRYAYKRGKAKKQGDWKSYKHYGNLMKSLPTTIEDDNYRKLEYIRYADDFLLSFAGPKKEANEIKEKIRNFLKDRLRFDLSLEKILITHARTKKAKFLGYDLRVRQSRERRVANGSIWFGTPTESKLRAIKKYREKNKAKVRFELVELSDYDIVTQYQSEYRGLANFYVMAHNRHTLNKVRWEAEKSLIRTLARKHRTSVKKTYIKYRGKMNGHAVIKVQVEREGKAPLTTYFGGISLKRNPYVKSIKDEYTNNWIKRSQLIERLLVDQCEMCGQVGNIEVHHVRKLKDVNIPGKKNKPAWVHRMAAIRRKTLMTCVKCHKAIHAGKHLTEWDVWKNLLESRVH